MLLFTDKEPTLVARAVPIELIKPIALSICEGYEKAKTTPYEKLYQITSLDNLVCSDLTYSKKNCEWYSQFYTELEDIVNIANIFKIPKLDINPANIMHERSFALNPLNLHTPMLDEYYRDLVRANIDSYKKMTELVGLSRLMLLDLNPKFEDFIKGVPVWYTKFSEPLLEAYDQVNRRHIRIVAKDGRLRYMTSIISDNWTEIKDVPPEMDIIVKYLISNRANLTLTDE